MHELIVDGGSTVWLNLLKEEGLSAVSVSVPISTVLDTHTFLKACLTSHSHRARVQGKLKNTNGRGMPPDLSRFRVQSSF